MILLDDDPQKQEKARNEQILALAAREHVPCVFANIPVDNILSGIGDNRQPLMAGVEVKKPRDLAESILRSGRLLGQFERAQEYGCSRLYLVVQGITRPGKVDGLWEMWTSNKDYPWQPVEPQIHYSRVMGFWNTLWENGGIRTIRTSDAYETAASVVGLWKWWQTPPEEHSSLSRFAEPVHLAGGKSVPLFRKLMKEFPGVGWQRSMDFLLTFGNRGLSIRDVLNMGPRDWQQVKGIGKGTAEKMEETLTEEIRWN